ncbi:hypothetical protein AB0L53_42105 [Nonomuraea sp. NPDC052129]|uniref:hypothetical protein n=1 Tax=Nonomuraea sp. NPDC052129 TaxID=3154651 RepID=UPI00342163AA
MLGLIVLAPLVAEYLMGNAPVTSISVVFVIALAPYGTGALLIREFARRTGRGWPTMMTLALAYGMIEEAYTTQTLWNPNWSGVRILDYGFIPALGIAAPWTLFMVGVHTVFSISVPIAVVEILAGSRRTTPWLGKVGFAVTGALFLAIVLLGTRVTMNRDGVASAPQLIGAGVVIAAIIAIGLSLGRRTALPTAGRAPSPWAAGALALVAGAVFVLLYAVDPTGLSPWLAKALPLPAWLSVVIYLALFVTVGTLIVRWSRRPGWSDAHRLALAGGAMLTYAWHSFPWKSIEPASPAEDLTSNAILTAGTVALLVVAALRLRHSSRPQHP